MMQNIILEIMQNFGYFGVFFLIFIENVFPPIPSEVILLLGGFLVTFSNLNVLMMIVSSTLGSLVGAIVLYYLGYILNENRLKKIVNGKLGKILFLKEGDIDKASNWFSKKGNKTVFLCRFIPIVRSLISIPAGINKMKLSKFFVYTICGSMIWNTILICLGYKFGENWPIVSEALNEYSFVIKLLLFSVLIIWIFKHLKREKSQKIN